MVFGLFTRKSTADAASPDSKTTPQLQNTRLPTPTPSISSVARHSPLRFPTVFHAVQGDSTTDLTLKHSDLATDDVPEGERNVHSFVPPRPVTPPPLPVGPDETKTLYDLMLTVPPKTLHAYTLAQLRPPPPQPSTSMPSPAPAPGSHPDSTQNPPSPSTATKLVAFFSTLAPPPSLHCVRCHKDFYDIENEEKDRACRIPHDDESALVSRVSEGGYETLWGCCGQTASGDGSEGPPDGWCYEGKHTTDVKRARFRADSTIDHDKLTSCLKLNCHGIRDRLPRRDLPASPSRSVGTSSARKSNPSPTRSQASVLATRSSRKRPRESLKETSGSEVEADAESLVGHVSKAKHKEKASRGAGKGDKDVNMTVDEPSPLPRSKVMAKSRPISRALPPPSTSATASVPASGSSITPVVFAKARTTATKPKSTSSTLLSRSHTRLASDSEASTHSRPRTRSHVREESRVRNASRSRTASRLTKADVSRRTTRGSKVSKPPFQCPTSEEGPEVESDEHQESDQERRGRDRKKRRVGRS